MVDELTRILPLAITAAVNPTGLCALIAVLATTKQAAALSAGFCLVFVAVGIVVLALGLRISGGHQGPVSGTTDIVASATVLCLGLRSLLKRSKGKGQDRSPWRLGEASGFALAATDVT